MRIGRKETIRYSSRRLRIRVYRARVRSQTAIYVWDVWINIGGDRIRGFIPANIYNHTLKVCGYLNITGISVEVYIRCADLNIQRCRLNTKI